MAADFLSMLFFRLKRFLPCISSGSFFIPSFSGHVTLPIFHAIADYIYLKRSLQSGMDFIYQFSINSFLREIISLKKKKKWKALAFVWIMDIDFKFNEVLFALQDFPRPSKKGQFILKPPSTVMLGSNWRLWMLPHL